MRKFTQHWYAPAAFANFNLTTGEVVDGEAKAHCRTEDGGTQGMMAVKPYPLDFRGCLVRRETNGEVTITLGARLVDYFRGTPAEVAALLVQEADNARPEDHRPTRLPFIGQDYDEWARSGDGPCEEHKKLLRERAALIAAM